MCLVLLYMLSSRVEPLQPGCYEALSPEDKGLLALRVLKYSLRAHWFFTRHGYVYVYVPNIIGTYHFHPSMPLLLFTVTCFRIPRFPVLLGELCASWFCAFVLFSCKRPISTLLCCELLQEMQGICGSCALSTHLRLQQQSPWLVLFST
jgi:hypothetical protein